MQGYESGNLPPPLSLKVKPGGSARGQHSCKDFQHDFHEVLTVGERARQHAPDTVRVEFERSPDLLDEFPRHLDDGRARQAGDAGHLHRVPTSTLAHDVAVERVEDTLVRELERVIQDDHRLGLDDFGDGTACGRLVEVLLPILVQTFVRVTAVTEGPDGVDVEGVLALADDRLLGLDLGLLRLGVHLARVIAESLVEQARLLGRRQIDESTRGLARPLWRELLLLERVPDHLVLAERGREVFASPCPLHATLALLARPIEIACGAVGFRHDRIGLKSIGQHDVGVHGGDVEMVDERRVLPQRSIAQLLEHRDDLTLDLVVILDVLDRNRLAALLRESERQSVVEIVDELCADGP